MTAKKVSGPKCWWCSRNLNRARSSDYIYAEIKEQMGNIVKVHITCRDDALKEIKKSTAGVPENLSHWRGSEPPVDTENDDPQGRSQGETL